MATNAEAQSSDKQASFASNALPQETFEDKIVMKKSEKHSNDILTSFMNLKSDGILCDVTIKAVDLEIQAHKIVLVSASDYFKAMFINETKESTTGIVHFDKMSSEVVKQCVNFIYSGEVGVSMVSVRELLDASEMMQLPELCKICVEFLAERIDLKSCAEVISLSAIYDKDSLGKLIEVFLASHFEEFIETNDFLSLNYASTLHCLELLPQDFGIHEIQKWKCIIAWVAHDTETRKGQFFQLFQTIDLILIPKAKVKDDILPHPLVQDSKECLDRIALLYCEDDSPPCKQQRLSIGKFLSCNKGSQAILQYDAVSQKWSLAATSPTAISENCDIISYDGCIYVGIGHSIYEFSDGKWSKTSSQASTIQRSVRGSSWRTFECLLCGSSKSVSSSCPSIYNKCVGVDDSVYMVSKAGILQYLLEEERFTCHEVEISNGNGFFITATQGKIYVMGGEGTEKQMVEFDLVSKKIGRLQDMLIAKPSGCASWYDGKIYAFPNLLQAGSVHAVECYNPRVDSWTIVPGFCISPLIRCLKNVFIGDKLYLIGGGGDGVGDPPFQIVDLKKLKVADAAPSMDFCFSPAGQPAST